MLLGILGFLISTLGIIGYFIGNVPMVVIGFIYIIVEALIGLYTGELRSIGTYVLAIVIGVVVAAIAKTNIFLTIAVALCFEEFIMGALASVILSIFSRFNKKNELPENKNAPYANEWKKVIKQVQKGEVREVENKTKTDAYSPNLANSELDTIQTLEDEDIHLQLDGVPITLHNLSMKHGYYKDVAYWEDGADDYFRKWVDKDTKCIYSIIDEVNGELESITVTKTIFDMLHAKFYNKEYQQVSLFEDIDAEPPMLDLNSLAFADEETQQKELKKYANDMYDFVKQKLENEGVL